jgi:hypothetical protein
MDLAFEKLGIKLAQLELEVIDVIKKIRRPIVWNDHGVGQTIENVNKLLVEAIDAEAIKQDLYQIDARLELSKLKSLMFFTTCGCCQLIYFRIGSGKNYLRLCTNGWGYPLILPRSRRSI